MEQVLATFGLILFFNEAIRIGFGPAALFSDLPPSLSGFVEILPGVPYPAFRLWVIVVGLCCALAIGLFVSRTRTGAMLRAGAENPEMAAALGVNIKRLFRLIFAAGATFAGIAGMMLGPLTAVQPGMGEPLLILSLVVIIIGGIGSVRGAFIAAIIVGLVDTVGRVFLPSLLRLFFDQATADGAGPALASMLVYILMAVILIFRPTGLFPAKGQRVMAGILRILGIIGSGMAHNRMLWLVVAGFGLFPIFTHVADLPFWNDLAMRIMLLGIAAMGLNLVLGYGGMVSFGHAAFIGIGAYCVGISQYYGLMDGWLHILFALLACGITGLIIGVLALRTSGIYFIMITLGFAQMLFFLFVSLENFGGDDGMSIDRAEFGIIDLYEPLRLYFLIWGVLVLVGVMLMVIVRSRFGVTLQAIKSNETRVEAMGLVPLHYKLVSYVMSAMICGLAGALFASWQEYVSPDIMHWTRSGELMIIIILGGLGTLAGPIIGAIVFLLLEEFLPLMLETLLPAYAENWMIIFGPLLVLVVLFGRGGLVGLINRIIDRLKGSSASRGRS